MKFTTTKEKILTAIQLAERIVGKRESIAVLSSIVLSAEGGVVVRSTNLEAGIEVHIPSEITETGMIAINPSVLLQTIRAISNDTVVLQTEDNNLIVESKNSRTLIKAVPHDEFPLFSYKNKLDTLDGLQIEREKLVGALQSVSYATSQSMIRPELGSVFITLRDKVITCVATDSFRLAEKKVIGIKSDEQKDILLPLKHVTECIFILEKIKSDIVTLYTDDSQIIIEGDGVFFSSRIIDGTFPNYKDIIPTNFTTEITTLKSDFIEIMRKARVFSGTEQTVGLHIYPDKKICTVTAQSSAIGEMSDTIDAALSGEDIDIKFHIGYLTDSLSSIDSDSITLFFSGSGRPMIMKGVSDTTFMYLVMPLNR